jgi:hypothetical protein
VTTPTSTITHIDTTTRAVRQRAGLQLAPGLTTRPGHILHLPVRAPGLELGVEEQREHHDHGGEEQDDAGQAELLEIHQHAHAQLDTQHGSRDHGEGQRPVDVAELSVSHARHQAFPGDVGHVDPRGHVARETKDDQGRGHHVAAAHPDEATHDTHREAHEDQQRDRGAYASNCKIEHGRLLRISRGAGSFPA